MTTLTSKQFRDVLRTIPGWTEDIPSVQQLLQQAVQTFYERFGAYPELAGVAPGKIGILGDQTQLDDGMALSLATPMTTIIVGRKASGSKFTVVTSAEVGKPHKVTFSFSQKRPLRPGCPIWLNNVKGIIDNYEAEVPPFEAAIQSSIPMGVGIGSNSALQVATYTFLELLVGKKTDPYKKVLACQKACGEYIKKEIGVIDRMTSVFAKDRHIMLIDCQTLEVTYVPTKNRETAFVGIDLNIKDTFMGDEYLERGKYLQKACEILGVESLRNCTEEDLFELENKVNIILSSEVEEEGERDEQEDEGDDKANFLKQEVWTKEDYSVMIKRVNFYVSELKRIKEAAEAWDKGRMDIFGKKMKESHESLKNFGYKNPILDFIVETSLKLNGVMGARMTGMGLNLGGSVVALIKKQNIRKFCEHVLRKFIENESDLREKALEVKVKEKSRQKQFQKVNRELKGKTQENGWESSRKRVSNALYRTSPCGRRKSSRISCIVKSDRDSSHPCRSFRNDRRHASIVEEPETLPENGDPLRTMDNETVKNMAEKPSNDPSLESLIGTTSKISQISEISLSPPKFYIVSPFAGARMMFVTRTDILRNIHAKEIPQPKVLVREALEKFKSLYNQKPQAVGLAPGTVTLFGEFMEFHLGYIICMALPMMTVTVGGRSDTTWFTVKTTSNDVEHPREMKYPLPCVRPLIKESRNWVNYILGTINEFKGFVPGFNSVITSSVPIQIGVNSCAALAASVYTFLESLTRENTLDTFEKADRCGKSEYEFMPTPTELVTRCSSIKFFPTFLSEEGRLMFINCKRHSISHYFFDHPSYVFLIATVKENTTTVTVENLEERLLQCMKAIEILKKTSLLNADVKHLNCLRKKNAAPEIVKRARYVITEHKRTVEALKAVKEENYERFGLLLSQSHASLRDDYEVSSPQIENLISLAMEFEGTLGAKMLGKGLYPSIIILLKVEDVDECIKYIKSNYKPQYDKPVFYMTKPSRGSYSMNPYREAPLIP